MAIYHFSGTVISRSQGRSAVACAAYRAGERLNDERYGKVQDYTKKADVVYTEIMAPKDVPEWVHQREKLWNKVEEAENRKDAQLAREFNFSLPKELSLEQNLQLAQEFVQEQFVNSGMIADLAIHADKKEDGFYYHAHVMLTLREVNSDGFGAKVREWNTKTKLLNWREAWAECANKYLALNDIEKKIDHRSYVDQQIELEPQHKLGAAVAKERLIKALDHARIAKENGDAILANPEIALDALTKQQSTFTHQDLARLVNRHSIDEQQFSAVYEAVKASPSIISLGKDLQQRERFTTKDMLALETRMLEQAVNLKENANHHVADGLVEASVGKRNLSPEQRQVMEHLIEPENLKCVIGFAGTGKSYLLGAAREAWEGEGYRVHGATLSGIAAETLEASSGIKSRTVASRAYYWNKGQEQLTSRDILVVDEAGMIGSRQMAQIIHEVEKARAKLVLVGDPQQLQAIEAGAAFRAITEIVPAIELTEIRRQKHEWQRDATKELAYGNIEAALARYEQADHIHVADTLSLAKAQLVEMWHDVRLNESNTSQIMLAFTRADVKELNELARDWLKQDGVLGKALNFNTERGVREFAENDRIYFLKNDRDLGVMNGTLGTITGVSEGEIKVMLDNNSIDGAEKNREISVNINFYNHLEHGYAATIHKAQGITVDRCYILLSIYLDAHAIYVALSRHRESVDAFYSKQDFPRYEDLIRILGTDRSKDVTLDYFDKANTLYAYIEREHRLIKNLTHKEEIISEHPLNDLEIQHSNSLTNANYFPKREEIYNHDPIAAIKARFESQYPGRAAELRSGVGVETGYNLGENHLSRTFKVEHNNSHGRIGNLNNTLNDGHELPHERVARMIEAQYDALDRALERGNYAPKHEKSHEHSKHHEHQIDKNSTTKAVEHNQHKERELVKVREKEIELSL